ncbi:MAG: hypothetical protein HWQ38_24105 [Nostoc sp. NMS7]|uniref:hypothetical protein n=1 Tax=Nostoc sp. NMS7 TaxID=2815391 RepID=UPI0025E80B75|nr:hypothetical protein [Nostoc sp. NMS7]MBN3949377.1 hypothetical protein [Nostoc sp. NMS7]
MHKEIELVSSLAGEIFSRFVDEIKLINQTKHDKLTDPKIHFYFEEEFECWIIRVSWMCAGTLCRYQYAYNIVELKTSLCSRSAMSELFLRKALKVYSEIEGWERSLYG